MNPQAASWPIWALVLLCGLAAQLFKLVLYSVTGRHLAIGVLGQSTGLPSLHAATLGCLATLFVIREGWSATTTGIALVMAALVIHDSIRLKGVAEKQRRVVYRLVGSVPEAGSIRHQVADYLDLRAHTPGHAMLGLVFGVLFALALGAPND